MNLRTESPAVGVSIEDITLSFGTTPVLTNVNLDIEPGEFFTFLGPSGSGKSTLLRLIAGFGPIPSTGRVLIGDREGITRFGDACVSMDEALARAAVDVGGRPFAVVDIEFRSDRLGTLST